MAKISDILLGKDTQVHSVPESATVLEATTQMDKHRVGGMIVMRDTEVVGIFTERDVLRRVVVAQRDPVTTKIADVMTKDVICCNTHDSIEKVGMIMKKHRIRHLPVVTEDKKLAGMISIGDLNAYLVRDREITVHYLSEYIYGRG